MSVHKHKAPRRRSCATHFILKIKKKKKNRLQLLACDFIVQEFYLCSLMNICSAFVHKQKAKASCPFMSSKQKRERLKRPA